MFFGKILLLSLCLFFVPLSVSLSLSLKRDSARMALVLSSKALMCRMKEDGDQ